MKKILFVLLLLVSTSARSDDWLLSLEDIRYQVRMAAGYDSSADAYMTDTLGSNFIREGFVAVNMALQTIRTVNSIVCTKYQNSYQLDTLQMGIYSVEWSNRDTVSTLEYVSRETWRSLAGTSLTDKKKPAYYDYSHDSIFIFATPIAADTLLIYGWEKAPDLDTITTLAFLRQAYRLAVLKYATWQAAMARQHPMTLEFKSQYFETLTNLKVGLGRGVPVVAGQ
ncbi:hypothetical protein KAR91_07360 [Candidatus Pacearchaeota archaeon]|nr:hypothetical protein [Candidatus Pacearchaeota archaeon]